MLARTTCTGPPALLWIQQRMEKCLQAVLEGSLVPGGSSSPGSGCQGGWAAEQHHMLLHFPAHYLS